MNNQNDAWMIQFMIYGMVLYFAVMVILVAGAFIAAGAVIMFCINEWYKIFRYEGHQPIMWLAGITAIVALIGIGGAATQLEIASQLEVRNRPSGKHVISAILYIASVALPSLTFWTYRLIKPISHFRIAIIDQLHARYQQGTLTRTERDVHIKDVITMGDETLEQKVAHDLREQETPPATIDHVGPTEMAPTNSSASPINRSSNPHAAFDIPQQRVDG